jgi:hypothetical protein
MSVKVEALELEDERRDQVDEVPEGSGASPPDFPELSSGLRTRRSSFAIRGSLSDPLWRPAVYGLSRVGYERMSDETDFFRSL